MIRYLHAPDIEEQAREISEKIGFGHDLSRIRFLRSKGSAARRTVARCHAMPRVMQTALNMEAHYIVEVISENFDKMSKTEREKTIIHELMHIPKSMKGGFRNHDYVCKRNIEKMHKLLGS